MTLCAVYVGDKYRLLPTWKMPEQLHRLQVGPQRAAGSPALA